MLNAAEFGTFGEFTPYGPYDSIPLRTNTLFDLRFLLSFFYSLEWLMIRNHVKSVLPNITPTNGVVVADLILSHFAT
jgi:hypothetical protein